MSKERLLEILKRIFEFDQEFHFCLFFWDDLLATAMTGTLTVQLTAVGFEIHVRNGRKYFKVSMVEFQKRYRFCTEDLNSPNSQRNHPCNAEAIALYDQVVFNELLAIAT